MLHLITSLCRHYASEVSNPRQNSCASLHNELHTRARLLKSQTQGVPVRVPLFDPRRPRNPLHGQCNRLPQRRNGALPCCLSSYSSPPLSSTVALYPWLGMTQEPTRIYVNLRKLTQILFRKKRQNRPIWRYVQRILRKKV